MSAEVLRQAASLMREDAMSVRRPFGRDERVAVAVADLLARVADDYEIAKHGYWSLVTENIARAYLGESA